MTVAGWISVGRGWYRCIGCGEDSRYSYEEWGAHRCAPPQPHRFYPDADQDGAE